MQQQPDGTFAQAFVVLTTRANALIAPIHDRMPVVLEESRLDEWMNPSPADPAMLRSMLRPAPEDWLVAERVSPLVNSVKNDGPELPAAATESNVKSV